MPKIEPPDMFVSCEVDRAGIFKCAATGNAVVGILWKNMDGKFFFEFTHGQVGDEMDPNNIAKICRTRCVGNYTAGDTAISQWNGYFSVRQGASGDKIWAKNWNVC
jgi:hypothetical protein